MSWTALLALLLATGMLLVATFVRRQSLLRMQQAVRTREGTREDRPQLQHPFVDLSRCLGCGACVRACPEEGVLDLVHGQAMVVRGARCVGHAACEAACPVDAITVTLGDTSARDDIPALTGLEAVGTPGLFLAGELTARSLIATALEQGTAVAAAVAARRKAADDEPGEGICDLAVVGSGPAGLACALGAKEHGLDFVVLEQEETIGGTVAKYPRRKLVLTQPIELPLVGRIDRRTYLKEELVELWQQIAAEHDLPIATGCRVLSVERRPDGCFRLATAEGEYLARNVCLAMGRRGVPRRLSVAGEHLAKVAYSLLDAESYDGRRVLVVGGGDAAVEAALALGEQPRTEVTLAHRGAGFPRIRARNADRLAAAAAEGRVQVLTGAQVEKITPARVHLAVADGTGTRNRQLPNDDVFVMIGGEPPFELLQEAGVSFDPALRPKDAAVQEQGTGLAPALGASFVLLLTMAAFAWLHVDYYALSPVDRSTHAKHPILRPGMGIGLWAGIVATLLISANLLYLLRRAGWLGSAFGSLRAWMTSHVATGILALACTLLHAAMAPSNSVGGHAFWALAALVVTGAIGRYFYAYVPRAANGRELELSEVKAALARLGEHFDAGHRAFGDEVRAAVLARIEAQQWRSSFFGRLRGLLLGRLGLHLLLHRLAQRGREQGLAPDQIEPALVLAARAFRTATMAAHYEDLRALLGTWRFLHRWIAALMVLLVVVHVVHALTYATIGFGGAP